jgi:cellulose synthase/poly-beta-1,6-N-acetylglucosamine synthase-like glycosyltransferase
MITSLYFFSIGLLTLMILTNRYILGRSLKLSQQQQHNLHPALKQEDWPSVCVIIPCYNEGKGIAKTIRSILASDYPAHLLQVIVVDDCSQDDSAFWASQVSKEDPRVRVLVNDYNMGKRKGINKAVLQSDATMIVSVDSDVILDSKAISYLMNSFHHSDVAAVGGKVKVWNAHENWLTKMQTIKYYFGYEFLKSLENHQEQVMCLSGCLTAYRRHILVELGERIEDRNILGIPIKYGEDRYLTRQILNAGYKTKINLKAYCYTMAPKTIMGYFKQQLRWRRSNYVDFFSGLHQLHKLKPLLLTHYLSSVSLQFVYPVVVFFHFYEGDFFILFFIHSVLLLILCLFYLADQQYSSWKDKVNPLWFLSMGLMMPVTYLFLSPLALFTLDSGSWETRQKGPL